MLDFSQHLTVGQAIMPPGCFALKAKQQLPKAIYDPETCRFPAGLCIVFGFSVNLTVGEGL